VSARVLCALVLPLLVGSCGKRKSEVKPLTERDGRSQKVTCKLPDGDVIATRVVVPERCELLIARTIRVAREGSLRIEPGARLSFAKGTTLRIEGGGLVARGTERDPITFTSATDPPSAGDWGGLVFEDDRVATSEAAPTPELDRVVVEYAGAEAPEVEAAITVRGGAASLSLSHATIRRNKRAGLRVLSGASRIVRFEGNVFESNDRTSLDLPADLMGSIPEGTFTDPVRLHGPIAASQTWPKLAVPVIVRDSILIGARSGDKPVVVTLAEGTVVASMKGKGIMVGYWPGGDGSLIARKVRFTSAEDRPAAGDWNGLRFGEHAAGSVLDQCVIEFAGHTLPERVGIELPLDDKKISVSNTTFRDGSGPAFAAPDCTPWETPARGNTSAGKPLCVPAFWGLGLSGTSGSGPPSVFGPGSK
jgi:hypothetical protein